MNKNNYKKGFSLVEIVVVTGILGMIMLAVASFQRNVIVYNKYSQDTLSSIQDARNIIRIMVKDLRTASQGNNGSYALANTATSTITFYSDTDGDGLKEQVRYYISSSTLIRGSIKPSGNPIGYTAGETNTILAYNIRNGTSTALFEYFDDTYTGTSSPLTYPLSVADIKLVKINLLINADPNKTPIPKLYTSQVTLRNLKDNL